MTEVIKGFGQAGPLPADLLAFLPAQGSIELQRDVPGKVHDFHRHTVDEVLFVIAGSLVFNWEGESQLCRPGDRIVLPAGTLHRSEAMEEGAVYAILTSPPSADL